MVGDNNLSFAVHAHLKIKNSCCNNRQLFPTVVLRSNPSTHPSIMFRSSTSKSMHVHRRVLLSDQVKSQVRFHPSSGPTVVPSIQSVIMSELSSKQSAHPSSSENTLVPSSKPIDIHNRVLLSYRVVTHCT